MIFADTGFFLSTVEPRDALHSRARAWIATLHEPLLLTEFVLLEVINPLSPFRDRHKVEGLVTHVRCSAGYTIVPVTSELLNAGLVMHIVRPDKEGSLTDCISFVVLKQRGIACALAHDHHFEQAGFEAWLRRDPP